MHILVTRETELPVEALGPLVSDAGREGHAFVMRALRAWTNAPREARPGCAFFVAWSEGAVVGMAGLAVDADGAARVEHLYVRPAFRRRGVGAAMMERLLAHARRTFTSVRAHAPGASAFFERVGFARTFGDPATTHVREP